MFHLNLPYFTLFIWSALSDSNWSTGWKSKGDKMEAVESLNATVCCQESQPFPRSMCSLTGSIVASTHWVRGHYVSRANLVMLLLQTTKWSSQGIRLFRHFPAHTNISSTTTNTICSIIRYQQISIPKSHHRSKANISGWTGVGHL